MSPSSPGLPAKTAPIWRSCSWKRGMKSTASLGAVLISIPVALTIFSIGCTCTTAIWLMDHLLHGYYIESSLRKFSTWVLSLMFVSALTALNTRWTSPLWEHSGSLKLFAARAPRPAFIRRHHRRCLGRVYRLNLKAHYSYPDHLMPWAKSQLFSSLKTIEKPMAFTLVTVFSLTTKAHVVGQPSLHRRSLRAW